ncbi:transposase [Paraferrimonas sedimenticola]|uniref:Transposase n=1 Tax=Paraferrimonas sedimenticola TaxID=375674 RepID=A0AA37W1K4_9GAMM|nr:transposase [Paraferrimonas sedimenticola]GLP96898.1 transposase [Paraferrimonas sedimenticola]
MPRGPRHIIANVPVHIIHRGNNRQTIFHNAKDHAVYHKWLGEALAESKCTLHAFCLMPNHTHLLITPPSKHALAKCMKKLSQIYAMYYNREYHRCGVFWESRYKHKIIEDEQYLMTCYRYIELNPVRAGMVSNPSHYRWSSHRFNAHNQSHPFVKPHPIFRDIDTDLDERALWYRQTFGDFIGPNELEYIEIF